MIQPSITTQLNQLNELANVLSQKSAGKATANAINRALVNSKGLLKRAIQQQYKIPSKDLKEMAIFRSSWQSLTGKLGVNRKPISLSHFNPVFYSRSANGITKLSVTRSKNGLKKSMKAVTRGRAKGVTFEVKKGQRMNIPYAFLTKNDSEKPVFARGKYQQTGSNYDFIARRSRVNKTGSDTPITKLLTTSMYGALQNTKVNERVSIDVSDYFAKRLEHEIRYQISKIR
jgi:hypothetical protein